MKKTIKLTESKIREMIAESVRKAINESENDAWAEYDTEKFFDDFSPTSKRAYLKSREYANKLPNEEFNGWADDLKDELDKSWKDTKDIEKYEKMADTRPLHRKGSLNRVGMDENVIRKFVSESIRKIIKEEIDTGQVPSASERHSTSPSAPEIRKKLRLLRNKISDYEEEGKDTSDLKKQINKLKKEAGFCESTNRIQNIVSESIKKVLNEKWYPEEEDDISDYSFGMIAKLTTRSDFELDEETIAKLENINDENVEFEDSYVSVMVRNVVVSCDQYGYCSITIECAVSAPDMPINEIEQEVEEILWYWFEEKTGERLATGFDWDSEDTVFDRRSRNK